MGRGQDLRSDVFTKRGGGGAKDMNAPELIEELEEFF